MPYRVIRRSGPRPYKIIRLADKKIVGSSVTRAAAEASIRARYGGEKSRRR